jgi:hypothetical protein
VPIEAPSGFYGSKVKRLKPTWLAGSAAGVVAFLVGIGVGSAGSGTDASPAAFSAGLVTPTVTSTVTAPPITTTQTLPAATVTAVKTVTSVKTVKSVKTVTKTASEPLPLVGGGGGSVYYDTCSDARAAGDTPLYAGDPGYSSHLDRDGDGVACE